MVTVSALMIVFLILIMSLMNNGQLLPGIVMLGSFILGVLWLTGLVATGLQLYSGANGGVSATCNTYITGVSYSPLSLETLAQLAQKNICEFPSGVAFCPNDILTIAGNCWSAAFAFEIVGFVFLIWMMVMSYQVNRDDFE